MNTSPQVEASAERGAMDVLLELYREDMSMWRHIDTQTSLYNQINIATVSALLASTQLPNVSVRYEICAFVFICVLGIFGFVSTGKFRERLYLSIHRIRALRKRLDDLIPSLALSTMVEESRRANRKRFPVSSLTTRGFVWWGVNLVVLLVGIFGLIDTLPASADVLRQIQAILAPGPQ